MSFTRDFKEKIMYFPPHVKYIIEKLNNYGYSAYAVGGCVRDGILGIIPHDYDIATSATPQDIKRIFKNTVDTGSKYGTVTVMYSEKPVEVTTYRKDGIYSDNRRPESVVFSDSITDDLSRRDFTINAMAASLNSEIIDPYGGHEDIKKSIIRCVGDPTERFSEDALRIMRAFRFASQLNFDVEADTLNAALKLSDRLETISAERICYELIKTIMGKKPSSLGPLIDSGGLSFLGIKHAGRLKLFDKIKHNLQRESAFASFCFLCGVNPEEICKKLKADKCLREKSRDICRILYEPPLDITAKKYMLAAVGQKYIYDIIYLFCLFNGWNFYEHKRQVDYILCSREAYKLSMLAVNGNDIMGLCTSKEQIGKILNMLLNCVIEHPEKNNKTELIKLTKEYIGRYL